MSTLDGGRNSPAEKLDKYRTSTSQQIHVLFITNLKQLNVAKLEESSFIKIQNGRLKKTEFFLNRQ